MSKIIELLKKLFSLQILSLIIALTSLYFAYIRYAHSEKGEVVSVVYDDNKEQSTNIDVVIVATNDTIKLPFPRMYQRFKNISKYSINHLSIEYSIISNPQLDSILRYKQNSSFEISGVELNGQNRITKYLYKSPILYQNETTPFFLQNIMLYPKVGKYEWRHFDIQSRVQWDGAEPHFCNTRINFCFVHSDTTYNNIVNVLIEPNNKKYKEWNNDVSTLLSKTLPSGDNYYIISAYHTYLDSIVQKGCGANYYYDISNENVSLIADPPLLFLESHVMGITGETSHKKGLYNYNILGIVIIISSIIFLFIAFTDKDRLTRIYFGLIFISMLIYSFKCFSKFLYEHNIVNDYVIDNAPILYYIGVICSAYLVLVGLYLCTKNIYNNLSHVINEIKHDKHMIIPYLLLCLFTSIILISLSELCLELYNAASSLMPIF